MKKMFITGLLIAAASLAVMSSATASSHSAPAREATRTTLVAAVEKVCVASKAVTKDCTMLRIVANDLYKDPGVVTRADFARLNVIKTFLGKHAETSEAKLMLKAQLDLKNAVDQAEALSLHVAFMHGSRWEDADICIAKTA